jgi:hypothetical protein
MKELKRGRKEEEEEFSQNIFSGLPEKPEAFCNFSCISAP